MFVAYNCINFAYIEHGTLSDWYFCLFYYSTLNVELFNSIFKLNEYQYCFTWLGCGAGNVVTCTLTCDKFGGEPTDWLPDSGLYGEHWNNQNAKRHYI